MSEIVIKDTRKFLPHRYPFLLVDRLLSFEAFKSAKAIKNVTINEPFFQGHFPAKPVMPGVLIIEALAQAAGLLMCQSLGWPEGHDKLCFLAGIDKVRFKRIVVPGDQLELNITVLKHRSKLWKVMGEATVDGELATIAEITAIQGDN